MSLQDEITTAINRASAENGSDTPDYILAHFLANCLAAFDVATRDRDIWHGFTPWNPTPHREAHAMTEADGGDADE